MTTAIEFENISKQYRLGLVSTGTLSHDLNRFWQTKVLRREDPYLKVGEVNDRAHKGESEYVWALKDINFKVEQGDVVGIIGRNGAGKSTLLKLLSRVTAPTTGTIRARGRIASLLEVGTGFHPEMTGRENIYMNGAIMGMNRAEITRKLDEIVDFSGCERYLDTPVKRYSSGMTVRLGFAIAAHLEPEILVVDEVLAVGDAEFQKKAIGKMQDVSRGEGRTVLFVSHNMAAVRSLCKRGIVLKSGLLNYDGNINDAIEHYSSEIQITPTKHVIITDDLRIDEEINKHRFDYLEAWFLNDPENMATEEPIRMRFRIKHIDFSQKTFQVGIFIANGNGQRVACCYTDPVRAPENQEVFDIEVLVPHHNLAKGKYTIDLKLSNFNYINYGSEYDQIAKVFSFEINYVDEAHTKPFGNWIPNYGNSCMRDVSVKILEL